MSGVLKVVGKIAGAVALVAGTIATFGIGTVAFAATMGTVAAIAGTVAAVASIGAQILARPPPARGTVTQMLIAADAPQPYVMGEGYFAGVLRHDTAWGATLNKVPNPYRFMPVVYSGGGPVQSITPQVDQAAVGSWYSGFLFTDTQLGACPEATALTAQWAGTPGWGAGSKLSGQAAIGWSFLFDKDGKRFASGIPQLGAHGQWVKVYDPRLDSTFPGGSGAHRVNDEDTWTWSANPALHAGVYALGRYQNGLRTFGVGMPPEAIDWVTVAAWANVCTANSWTIFGAVYEPGNRWENLQSICLAGGGQPVFAGGLLSFRYSAPKVALDTVTAADLAGDPGSVTAMQSWRDRINTVIPKVFSADHEWQQTALAPVSNATLVTEDGEVKTMEWPFLTADADQGAQLGRYRIEDSRELPISLALHPRLRHYRPGECLHLTLPDLGLDHDAVILSRRIDPETFAVHFEFITETGAKHAFALGETGVPPATPALGQTAQQRDELIASTITPSGYTQQLIANSSTDPAFGLLTATDAGTNVTIAIADHTRSYPDKTVALASVPSLTAQPYATLLYLYYDDAPRTGGAPTVLATTDAAVAGLSDANPNRHAIGYVLTPAAAGGPTTGGGVFDTSTVIANIDWGSLGLY